MDRHRGSDRGGGERHRGPSRWSDGPPVNSRYSSHGHSRGAGGGGFEGGGRHHPYRGGGVGGTGGPPDYTPGGGGGGGGGRHHPYRGSGGSGGGPPEYPPSGGGGFDSGTRHHSYRGGGGDGSPDYPSGGGGVGGGLGFRHGPDGPGDLGQVPMGAGQRRGSGFSGSGRGGSPDNADSSNFAKLFIGSVPRTATEEDVRPLFEEHGNVIEVALIKDRRTGQQQGCCFVKYATSEEAERAIRALHNQYTLPGAHGPVQVRYADGERERLVEYKLFVGSLNKQATEKEVEEIFSRYGRVEDVYIMKDDMKQSRGCGFVKFSNRDMAAAAIDALNGKYTMRGCEQPLTVRFADPKRPRPGETRGGPTFGGPGYGSRSQPQLGPRSVPNLSEGVTDRRPNAASGWHPASPHSHITSSQVGTHDTSKISASASSSFPVSFGALGGPLNDSLPGLAMISSSSMPQQGFSPSLAQGALLQQISPLQKPLVSPQHLPSSLQMHPLQQTSMPYSQGQTLQAPMQQLSQLQIPHSGGLTSLAQVVPSQQLIGVVGQLPTSQSTLQHLSMHQQGMPAPNQQQLGASNIPHQLVQQHVQQSPTHMMLQQQTQSLQSTFQSTQQAFTQLQQQLQQMQPTLNQQQSSQATKQQSAWGGSSLPPLSSSPVTGPATVTSSTMSAIPTPVSTLSVEPLTCNWTEHTSPEGYKYYYNSVTKESKWEKPEELILFERQQQKFQLQQQQSQQQHQKSVVSQHQAQTQPHMPIQVQSAQHVAQFQQVQTQMQIRQQAATQFLQPTLAYQASGAVNHQNTQVPSSAVDPVRVQQVGACTGSRVFPSEVPKSRWDAGDGAG